MRRVTSSRECAKSEIALSPKGGMQEYRGGGERAAATFVRLLVYPSAQRFRRETRGSPCRTGWRASPVLGPAAKHRVLTDPPLSRPAGRWTALLFAAITAYPAGALRSAISALFAALAVGVAFIAAVDWIFDPTDIETFRWLILVLIVAYAVAAVVVAAGAPVEERRSFERHEVQMVNAAGIATVILGLTLFAAAVASSVALAFTGEQPPQIAGPFGWELALLIASAGLIAYAILRRQPGPGYLGAVGLTLFVILGGAPDDEATLVGWPLAVLLIATLALAATIGKRGAIRRTDHTAPPASGGSGPESGGPGSK
jgi:hypothetical protein